MLEEESLEKEHFLYAHTIHTSASDTYYTHCLGYTHTHASQLSITIYYISFRLIAYALRRSVGVWY